MTRFQKIIVRTMRERGRVVSHRELVFRLQEAGYWFVGFRLWIAIPVLREMALVAETDFPQRTYALTKTAAIY